MRFIRSPWIATAAVAAALCAGTARAGDVQWSIGIQAPLGNGASIGTVFSNGVFVPVVAAPQVVYAPAPVVVAPVYSPRVVYAPPPPVYVEPAPVYAPLPVYAPRRVVVAPVWVAGRWVWPRHAHAGWDGHRDHGDWDRHRDHDVRHHAPVYAPRAVSVAPRY